MIRIETVNISSTSIYITCNNNKIYHTEKNNMEHTSIKLLFKKIIDQTIEYTIKSENDTINDDLIVLNIIIYNKIFELKFYYYSDVNIDPKLYINTIKYHTNNNRFFITEVRLNDQDIKHMDYSTESYKGANNVINCRFNPSYSCDICVIPSIKCKFLKHVDFENDQDQDNSQENDKCLLIYLHDHMIREHYIVKCFIKKKVICDENIMYDRFQSVNYLKMLSINVNKVNDDLTGSNKQAHYLQYAKYNSKRFW